MKVAIINGNPRVTGEDIDVIMSAAIGGGGIFHWCDGVRTKRFLRGESISECLSNGDSLYLHEFEGKEHELTINKLMTGIRMCIEDPDIPYDIIDIDIESGKDVLDTGMIDAVVADIIIQYALFGELRFS